MLEADQLIELHTREWAALGKPLGRAFTGLVGEKEEFARHGLSGAPELDGNASLRGTAHKVRLDQAIESASFLPVGGCVRRTGMTLTARSTTITLYGLSVLVAMISTELHRASCSAAGA